MLSIPIKSRAVEVIAEALIQKVICIFSPPYLLIVYIDSVFTGKGIQLFFKLSITNSNYYLIQLG